jgi:arylsulfatase A-like enzyme
MTLFVLVATFAFVAVAGVHNAPSAKADPPTRPNIVVINTDDQRFDSLYSCMATPPDGRNAPGGTTCPMPYVRDDLMAHGVTFDRSYDTTSLCCPSRASLFLGQFAHHTGVLTNEKPEGGFAAFRNLQDSTIARWLHDSGYRTSLIGKYLNQYDACASVPSCAVPQGWDDWHAEIAEDDVDYTEFQLADSQGNGQAVTTGYSGYSTTILGEKAVSFVQDTLTNHPTQPMFLYLAPFAPHPDAEPATGDGHVFDSMTWRAPPAGNAPPSWNANPVNGPFWSTDLSNNGDHQSNLETFLSRRDREHRNELESLVEVDRQVHAVVQALGPAISNTLIVFTSDNGLSWGEHRYFDKKNCEFEECHRVPMVVRYDPLTDPGGTGRGRVDSTHPVLNIDIAATAAEAGQIVTAPGMDGRSFLPLLDADGGNDPADWRTAILGENYGGMIPCNSCVRTPTMALIRTFPQDPLGAWKYAELCALGDKTLTCAITGRELYDEAGDLYEMNNTAEVSPAPGSVQETLAARLALLKTTHAPAPSFTGGPPPFTPDTSATLSFQAVGASRFWCSLDGAPRTPCTSPVELPGPLAPGPHTFAVVAEGEDVPDGVTGTSGAVVRAWSVDNGPPDTTITGGPNGPTAATTAQFTFTSTEPGGTFQCSLDGAPFSLCTSPASFSGLTETSHTFAVKAIDGAGNEDPTPDSRSWTVDVTPPDTSIDSGPIGSTHTPGPYSFTFSSTEPGSTFQCRISQGSFVPCTSPYDQNVSGDGNYSLTVKATDPAGNTDQSPAVRAWTLDTVPPATPVLTQKPTDPSGPTVTFAWTDSDATATFTCVVDGAAPVSCTSPTPYTLGNGPHTFSVTATDPAANSSAPASWAWSVASGGPVVTITSNQNTPTEGSYTQSGSATFKFTSSMQGTAYQCSLDGAPFTTCVTGIQYTGLVDGTHAFAVRGTAGGITGQPTTRTWTVDRQPPDTTITVGPSGPTAGPGPFHFEFTSTEAGATFRCKLDGAAFAVCTSPYDIPGPLSGQHTLQVKSVDQANNSDATPDVRTWTIDSTPPPVPSITQKPAAMSSSNAASFSFSDTEGAVTFRCSLDGEPPAVCTSPKPYSSLADGLHTFAVTASDGAGNTSAAASWQWTVDTDPPDTTITDGPTGTTPDTTAQFVFESDEANSTFQCQLDGTAFTSCPTPKSYSNLGPGDHTFAVRAVDAAGNQDPVPDSRSWTIGATVPETTINGGPANGSWVGTSSAAFTFTSNIPGSTFQCSVDGAPFAPCDSGGAGASPTGLADGPHTFAVYAEAPGGADPTPATRSWSVDTHAPTVSITAPEAEEFLLNSPTTVKWSAAVDPAPSSGTSAYTLQERDGSSSSWTTVASGSGRSATRTVGATTCWQATATDPAGNTGSSTEVCASVPFDDRSPSVLVTGTTTQVADAGAYLSTITMLQGADAQMTLAFTGRKAGVLLQKRPDGGKVKVYLDDVLVQTVDTYATSLGEKKPLWNGTMPAGPHTIRLVWAGSKNKNSTGFDIGVDGISVIATPS